MVIDWNIVDKRSRDYSSWDRLRGIANQWNTKWDIWSTFVDKTEKNLTWRSS